MKDNIDTSASSDVPIDANNVSPREFEKILADAARNGKLQEFIDKAIAAESSDPEGSSEAGNDSSSLTEVLANFCRARWQIESLWTIAFFAALILGAEIGGLYVLLIVGFVSMILAATHEPLTLHKSGILVNRNGKNLWRMGRVPWIFLGFVIAAGIMDDKYLSNDSIPFLSHFISRIFLYSVIGLLIENLPITVVFNPEVMDAWLKSDSKKFDWDSVGQSRNWRTNPTYYYRPGNIYYRSKR